MRDSIEDFLLPVKTHPDDENQTLPSHILPLDNLHFSVHEDMPLTGFALRRELVDSYWRCDVHGEDFEGNCIDGMHPLNLNLFPVRAFVLVVLKSCSSFLSTFT